jgi:hypothetical protein
MALHKATQVAAGLPVPNADAAMDLIPIFGDFTVPAAGFASGDVVEMAPLPAGYVPVDVIADNEALGATMTFNVGILSGAYGSNDQARTCGAEFMSAQAFQTAGIKRMSAAGGGRIAPTTADRGIGLACTTITTPTAGARVRLTVLCRPAVEGA